MNMILSKKTLISTVVIAIIGAITISSCQQREQNQGKGGQNEEILDLGKETSSVESSLDNQDVANLAPVELPKEISFNEHIQPILSESCYHCHGPDPSTRAPKEDPLRLDLEEFAFAVREATGKAAILPGNPDESDIIVRVESDDPALMMPPPGPHHHLNEQQVALLREWINQGAVYEDHWAFLPPQRAELPLVSEELGKIVNPIDAFVLAEYEAHGLQQKQEATPARLVRRIFLDVVGLPPTPQEVIDFETAYKQDADRAIHAVLDDLFQRTSYGEKQARHWLDVARYADTHGFHYDNYRSIWPYRDWVIDAFNANMPWDQFTIEQLAGDLLPEPSLTQQIATGFQRCMPTTGEGGAIPEEYAAMYAQDQVDTMAAAWLGLTTNCASCHDHKFDPISMRDNYQLTAFFRNTTMKAMDGNRADHAPSIFVPIDSDWQRWHDVQPEIAQYKQDLETIFETNRETYQQFVADNTGNRDSFLERSQLWHIPLHSFTGTLNVVGEDGAEAEVRFGKIDGIAGAAPDLGGGNYSLGDRGQIDSKLGHTISFWVYPRAFPSGALFSRMDATNHYRGWDVFFERGKIGGHVAEKWPENAAKIMSEEVLLPDRWYHVALIYRPEGGANRMEIWINGENVAANITHNSPVADYNADAPLRLGGRFKGEWGRTDAQLGGRAGLQNIRIYNQPLNQANIVSIIQGDLLEGAEMLTLTEDQRKEEQLEVNYRAYLQIFHAHAREETGKMAALETELNQIISRGHKTLVMEEKANSEATAHILERGQYANKGEQVKANVPEILPPLPNEASQNRLGLAMWLVEDQNPLPARVTVNRLWAQLFGRGIVKSTSDFGIMGARPTHPELLDWLAVEFVESGWDYQHMIRLMITSATYRQAGAAPAEEYELDPENKWLARGPQFRLAGEEIRDLALAASGLLVDKVGGEPVKPYQPEGMWDEIAMRASNTRKYQQDSGENLYRRSIYWFWKRIVNPSSLAIFDAPLREVSCTERRRTNTPLHAFVLWNDPQFVEASRHLACATVVTHEQFDERLDAITLLLLSRTFDDEERRQMQTTLEEIYSVYTEDEAAAQALLDVGEAPLLAEAQSLPKAEIAAWTMLTNLIFNLDETITK